MTVSPSYNPKLSVFDKLPFILGLLWSEFAYTKRENALLCQTRKQNLMDGSQAGKLTKLCTNQKRVKANWFLFPPPPKDKKHWTQKNTGDKGVKTKCVETV